MCVCVGGGFFPFILDVNSVGYTIAGVTQEEGLTGFLLHLPSAVHAFIFLARRIQPFLSLVDREVEFCVLTILIVLHPLGIFIFGKRHNRVYPGQNATQHGTYLFTA